MKKILKHILIAALALLPLAAPCAYADTSSKKVTISEDLQGRANSGDPEAQYLIGMEYSKKDEHTEALRWLGMAADKQYPPALYMLGRYFAMGISVKQNIAKAAEYYAMAADAGHADSMFELAIILREVAKGNDINEQDAIKFKARANRLIKEAAEKGHEKAIIEYNAYLETIAKYLEEQEKENREILQGAMAKAVEITFPSDNSSLVLAIPSDKIICYKLSNVPHELIQMAMVTNKKNAEHYLLVFENLDQYADESGVAYTYDEDGLGQYILHNYMPSQTGTLYVLVRNSDETDEESLLLIGRAACVANSEKPQPKSIKTEATPAPKTEPKNDPSPVEKIEVPYAPTNAPKMVDDEPSSHTQTWLIVSILAVILVGIGAAVILLNKKPVEKKETKYGYYYELHISDPTGQKKMPVDLHAQERTPLIIGRSNACHITLNDKKVSSKHCSIQAYNGKLFLTDLGSTNGTKVNGVAVSPHQRISLHGGNTISLGNSQIQLNKYPSL